MTYKRIYDLKFKKHVPTFKLRKRFPGEMRKIARVALLQLPNVVLRELVRREKELRKLIQLREYLLKKNGAKRRNGTAHGS